jgi:hypothetical protein
MSGLFKPYEKAYMKEGTPVSNLHGAFGSDKGFQYHGTTLQYAVSGSEQELKQNTYLCPPDAPAHDWNSLNGCSDLWQIK